MDVRLILENGNQKGRETPLARGVYLVGRSRTCQIRPKNRYVSRKHCAFIHKKRELLVQDLGSRSGTFVNGQKIEPSVAVALQDGDRIRVGKTKFVVGIHQMVSAQQQVRDRNKDRNRVRQTANEQPTNDQEPEFTAEDSSSSNLDDVPSANEAKPTSSVIRDVEDVLNLLEEEDVAEPESPSDIFNLNTVGTDGEDQDDATEGAVDFAAPKSSESIDEHEPLPSYSLRQDWDVKGVYTWVSQKEAFAKQDQRRAKRMAKEASLANSNASEPQPATATSSTTRGKPNATARIDAAAARWSDWLESDSVRPTLMLIVAIVFFGWIAWNIWLLISFNG